ncbi:hypothetical protein [Phenylobacterium sp.]|uniref:hypothetical protein n=1 Tax=Phenylobacterium sp. TaxID=1871053 RepID=UPI002FC7894D
MAESLSLGPMRLFPADPATRAVAAGLFEAVERLPVGRMAAVVRAWLDSQAPGGVAAQRVLDPALFPAFRDDPRLGAAVIEART